MMLKEGNGKQGHTCSNKDCKSTVLQITLTGSLKKWMGHNDQHALFPLEVKLKLRRVAQDTLFVFADQALGPWFH
jgi:hypothetical protein